MVAVGLIEFLCMQHKSKRFTCVNSFNKKDTTAALMVRETQETLMGVIELS